ncbi:hypothetical protein JCM10212_002756 [Sporobolomyces blumeae]
MTALCTVAYGITICYEDLAPILAADGGKYSMDSVHSLVDLEFGLPRDADQRFVRLVQFFRFRVAHASIDTLHPSRQALPCLSRNRDDGPRSGVDIEWTDEVRPTWKLWSTCHPFW